VGRIRPWGEIGLNNPEAEHLSGLALKYNTEYTKLIVHGQTAEYSSVGVFAKGARFVHADCVCYVILGGSG
jgi:hypothetical protein